MQNKTLQMKRALRTALLVLLLGAAGMGKGYAYDFSAVCETGQTLYYSIIDASNHYVELTCPGTVGYYGWSGYPEPTGNLVLPESVQYGGVTYSVTSIGDYAFNYCSDLTGELIIPNSVTTIGECAFNECRFIGNLAIPNSVEIIGEGAFASSDSFHGTLNLGNSINTIGYAAFYGCRFFGTLTIPNSVTSLGRDAFTYCNFEQVIVESGNPIYDSRNNCNAVIETETNVLVMGCKNSIIPNSVTVIGEMAFRAVAITSIIIPNSVEEIRIGAFTQCYKLTSISIPSSVEYIETRTSEFMGGTFSDCNNLETITVEADNPVYDSRDNCNAIIESSTNTLIVGCKNSIIPNTVNTIGFASFDGCTGLSTIVIPNGVTYIDALAYTGCNHVESVVAQGEAPANLSYNGIVFNVPCTTLIVPCECVSAYEDSEWHWYFPTIIEDCTSLPEDDESVVAAFPNPTNSQIKIEAENLKHITISNMLGQRIYEGKVNGNEFSYDFGKHKAGIYLIHIETANGVAVKKVSVTQ